MSQVDVSRTTDVASLSAGDAALANSFSERALSAAQNGEVVEVYVADSIYDDLPVGEAEVAEIEAAYDQLFTGRKPSPKAFHELR